MNTILVADTDAIIMLTIINNIQLGKFYYVP